VPSYIAGSKIGLSHYVIPRDPYSTGARMKTSSDGDIAIETKYFEVAAAEASPDPDPTRTILAMQDVQENDSVTNFGTTNWNYRNIQQVRTAGFASVVDTGCSGGSATAIAALASVGGPRTLLEIEGSLWAYNQYNVVNYGDIGTSDWNKMVANVSIVKTNLYGGQSAQALANTFYISIGHFQPITAAVKTDTFDGVDKYIFNAMEIWGGDCYNCLVTYGHDVYSLNTVLDPGATDSMSWGIKFACQCNSNYDLRRGRLVEAVRMNPAASGVSYDNPVQLEGFSYNKGYSSLGLAFLYPALPTNFSANGRFPFRVRYAGQKFPAETVNSFRQFNVLDFKDMDGQGGEINNLKTKDGRTIVW